MSTPHRTWKSVAAAALLAAALSAVDTHAAAPATYTPTFGQEGKDVIWIPTPESLVARMLAIAQVKPSDFVVDLGSGDGRTVITAAKLFGARALGVEFNPDMVALSQRNARQSGVADRAQFRQGDIFATDFGQATVVTMYLLPALNLKLRPTLLAMKPGTRVVSHAFTMDDWQPDHTETLEGRTAYLWIVPARVEGRWRIELAGAHPVRYDIELTQRFQMLEGEARSGSERLEIRDARVRGDEVVFTIAGSGGARTFTGKLEGGRLSGTTQGAGQGTWSGARL